MNTESNVKHVYQPDESGDSHVWSLRGFLREIKSGPPFITLVVFAALDPRSGLLRVEKDMTFHKTHRCGTHCAQSLLPQPPQRVQL